MHIKIKPIYCVLSLALVLNACEKDNSDSSGTSSAVFNPNVSYGTMSDQDGNAYKTISIEIPASMSAPSKSAASSSTQTWMAENLRTTRYNDGSLIPNIQLPGFEWAQFGQGAYSAYNHNVNSVSIATYGLLYNWHAVNSGKLAPKGWHVASAEEWEILINSLGGSSVAGAKLKETGTLHWLSPNAYATNAIGFTALPAGIRDTTGNFQGIGSVAEWWCASEYTKIIRVYQSRDYVDGGGFDMERCELSIRCVKD